MQQDDDDDDAAMTAHREHGTRRFLTIVYVPAGGDKFHLYDDDAKQPILSMRDLLRSSSSVTCINCRVDGGVHEHGRTVFRQNVLLRGVVDDFDRLVLSHSEETVPDVCLYNEFSLMCYARDRPGHVVQVVFIE